MSIPGRAAANFYNIVMNFSGSSLDPVCSLQSRVIGLALRPIAVKEPFSGLAIRINAFLRVIRYQVIDGEKMVIPV
jgi:hypothetical protein